MAKRMIFFENYKPIDETLGTRSKDLTINSDTHEKKLNLRVEKLVKKFLITSNEPMKIIPKKPTVDLERKLKEKMTKLKIRTELAIVELLSKEKNPEIKMKETQDSNAKNMQEEPKENTKYLEEEPLVLESRKFEEIDWFEDITNPPQQTLENLVKGIQNRERIDLDDISDDEF